MAKSRRLTRSDAPDRLSREEKDKLICYRYAQTRNASAVGKEFGVNRMYVSRLWSRLTDEERAALAGTSEQVDEELNRRILEAERIEGDRFIRKIMEARQLAADELLDRFDRTKIKNMSNRDFSFLFRLVVNIAPAEGADDDPEKGDTFRKHRESIRADIENLNENKL